jgi:hypothetical protein
MHSFILKGSPTTKQISQAVQKLAKPSLPIADLKNSLDVYFIEPALDKAGKPTTIKIDQIRKLKTKLHSPPNKLGIKIVIFVQAELLTRQSQNALLKLLEEPQLDTKIFLTGNTANLLETIKSRCQEIIIRNNTPVVLDSKLEDLLSKLNSAMPGERLKLIEPYHKDKQTAKTLTQDLIVLIQTLLPQNTGQVRNLKHLLRTLQDLNLNINHKLALDMLMLNWGSKQGILNS